MFFTGKNIFEFQDFRGSVKHVEFRLYLNWAYKTSIRIIIGEKLRNSQKMRVLVFLLSVSLAAPVHDTTIVQKSCQITCSGKADNFMQYNSYALVLQGSS